MSENSFNFEVRKDVSAICLQEAEVASGSAGESQVVKLAVETTISVKVVDGPVFSTMASPQQLDVLAIGLLRGEGLIQSVDDIESIDVKLRRAERLGEACHEISVVLRPEVLANVGVVPCDSSGAELRQVTTSGQRLRRTVVEMIAETPSLPSTVFCDAAMIFGAFEQLIAGQLIRRTTRGTHAIGLLDPVLGRLISMAEDVGRHNAADKAIGQAMADGRETEKMVGILSSRISLEMLSKCAGAGIQIVASVSAPTTLAIEAAEKFGVTVCGSIREGRMMIFTRPERVTLPQS